MVVLAVLAGFMLALPASALAAERPPASPATALTDEDLFDQTVVNDLRLTMKAEDWAALKATFLEDTYYRADMAWRGQVVPIVGVRSRGSGSRNPHKPGLKVDFGRYVDQKFLGLKSVVLANAVQDPSMLKQRVSMLMFERMGLPAPRVTHVRVFVNDAYLGLYMLIEPIDKNFLARAFGTDQNGKKENDGYLYEYAWKDAYQWDYLGSDLQIYAELFEPKTRETDAPSLLYGQFDDLFRTTNEVRDGDFEPAVGEFLDLRTFVRYLAVENFIAERDGFLGYWGPNNFYMYRFQGRKLMQMIPWDKDLAFWAPDYDIFQGVEDNVLARRALAIPALRRTYLETLLACAATAMAPVSPDSPAGWLEAEVQKETAQIHASGVQDTEKPYSNERFDDELQKVLAFARTRGAFVVKEAEKALRENWQFRLQ
jgi:spore coat protein CotH